MDAPERYRVTLSFELEIQPHQIRIDVPDPKTMARIIRDGYLDGDLDDLLFDSEGDPDRKLKVEPI